MNKTHKYISEQHVLERVIILDKPGNGGIEVEPGNPISLCEESNAKYIIYFALNSSVSSTRKPCNSSIIACSLSYLIAFFSGWSDFLFIKPKQQQINLVWPYLLLHTKSASTNYSNINETTGKTC